MHRTDLYGTPPRDTTAAHLAEAVGHSTAWVLRHAKAGRLPGDQVPHPCVTGRLTWRFNVEEAQAAIKIDPDLWGMRGIKPGRELPKQRAIPPPPDDHHTLTGRMLAKKLGVQLATVGRWAAAGEVPSVRSGPRRWYNLEDVTRARQQRPQPTVHPPDGHHTLTTQEVAAALGRHKATVLMWARQRLVPSVRSGRHRWYNLEDVQTALLQAAKPPTPTPASTPATRPAPPDGHHTLTAAEAAAHARDTLAPDSPALQLNAATVQTWVRRRVLSGVQTADGTIWVNPETVVRLVSSLQGAIAGTTKHRATR